ncbi:MAG TPA: DUF1015 family protein [Verrucomicrobiae bacterium]|nr:DUF1015 family protein [Verrucomicrobiae bacterium]
MATIKPFAALRPKPELAQRICELPYDVMSSEEARQIAAGNPLSFLHVSKPEIDLPPDTDVHAPEVYAKGKENFDKLIAQGTLKQDERPAFYLYRQIMGRHSQVGLVAAASCEEYLKGIIKKHELTRPDKEDDRVRHIETLNSQTGPVFLTYRAVPALDAFIAKKIAEQPDVDFTAADGVRHTSWLVADAEGIRLIESEFTKIPFLYIADGHHRSAAAGRVYLKRREDPHPASGHPLPSDGRGVGGEGSASFLSVIFPHNQMQILPYNRVLKDLNGLTPEQLLQKLDAVFVIKPGGAPSPTRKHELALFLEGKWHGLTFRPTFAATQDPIEKLDVTLLQKYVLDPIFGIDDPRISKRVNFVGGIRGTAELEKLVNSGEYACAFSMFPTSIEDLMTIADAGGIMPPKSTWFEPKLRDAMFCHMI